MATTHSLNAANPAQNAIVKASAGVGKTYLLVTRLIRLLLDDVAPDAILAITFTRKAAAEMQSRLYERLYVLAISDKDQVQQLLESMGVTANKSSIDKAQTLYEQILQSPKQVKSTTFHAFCQDILQKFPLEADIPPGFELLEDIASYQQSAWELLYDEVTRDPECLSAKALETLFDLTGGIQNTHDSLNNFLQQRADWWAFTYQADGDVVGYATHLMMQSINYVADENIYALLFNDSEKQRIYRVIELWHLHGTKTILKHIQQLQEIFTTGVFDEQALDNKVYDTAFDGLWSVFYKTNNEIRESEPKNARAKKMGEAGEDEFLRLFTQVAITLQLIKDKRNVEFNYQLNQAWYTAGNRLIEIFQQIKATQRLLDFTDLEWKTYELLNHSDNALWVQYKLDQRIKHLLIDEFQDTNPTQWRLLLPIMEEFEFNEEARSVFIVGDEKQSIYSFRRADPLLLNQAGDWLREHLNGAEFPMDKSRRSSPEIMHLVNAVFESELYQPIFNTFAEHSTHLTHIPGWLRLLPLVESEQAEDNEIFFRNPLEQPRPEKSNPYLKEGELIAQTIQELINDRCAIGQQEKAQPIHYGDIMILIRSRRHVKQYEQALRQANIPYISNNKGTLLHCREIKDMVALLTVLHSPFNDIALATLLRSPIFNCTSQDLLFFHQTGKRKSWHNILMGIEAHDSERLNYAKEKITAWREVALHLPIHDLLDKIVFETHLMQRYADGFPPHLRERAQNNLTQFLSIALQIDSGRYPSLGRFLARLEHMRQVDASPDEATNANSTNAVRILTIHASKGLEAPVVFLADSCDAKNAKSKHYQTIVDWPQEQKTPTAFRLCPVKEYYDVSLRDLLQVIGRKEKVEDANLLYVALTRARQAVYISGTTLNGEAKGWYAAIQTYWPTEKQNQPTTGAPEPTKVPHIEITQENLPNLFDAANENLSTQVEDKEEDSQLRGIIIHRALELLTQGSNTKTSTSTNNAAVLRQLQNEFGATQQQNTEALYHEALNVIQHEPFKDYFQLADGTQYFNEIPLQSSQNNQSILGIIDRLIVTDNECIIIDYKTHNECAVERLADIAMSYHSQMTLYRQMTQKIWPEKNIQCHIVFTHYLQAITVTLDSAVERLQGNITL